MFLVKVTKFVEKKKLILGTMSIVLYVNAICFFLFLLSTSSSFQWKNKIVKLALLVIATNKKKYTGMSTQSERMSKTWLCVLLLKLGTGTGYKSANNKIGVTLNGGSGDEGVRGERKHELKKHQEQ